MFLINSLCVSFIRLLFFKVQIEVFRLLDLNTFFDCLHVIKKDCLCDAGNLIHIVYIRNNDFIFNFNNAWETGGSMKSSAPFSKAAQTIDSLLFCEMMIILASIL